VLAIEAGADPGWWQMTTPRGTGQLGICADDDDEFDRQAALVDTELAKLKDILESQPPIVA
jgi:hypothetical protein